MALRDFLTNEIQCIPTMEILFARNYAFKYFSTQSKVDTTGYCFYWLAVLSDVGFGCKPDLKMIFEYSQKSAALKCHYGYSSLGLCYYRGEGCQRNMELALKWISLAAKENNAIACHNMGVFYENEEGVELNYPAAISFYQTAANMGYRDSMLNLGGMKERGLGCEKDIRGAIELYKRAAELGNDLALTNIGICYLFGKGKKRNVEKAKQYFLKAPFCASASYYLGYIWENENIEKSIFYYLKAQKHGYDVVGKISDLRKKGYDNIILKQEKILVNMPWELKKLLWVGYYKGNEGCHIDMLPIEIVFLIINIYSKSCYEN